MSMASRLTWHQGEIMERENEPQRTTDRRSFLLKGAALGAGAVGVTQVLSRPSRASADGGLTSGDVAILQFLAAAELLEADMWEQYNEPAVIQDHVRPGGGSRAYKKALSVLDEDMSQYIHDNA